MPTKSNVLTPKSQAAVRMRMVAAATVLSENIQSLTMNLNESLMTCDMLLVFECADTFQSQPNTLHFFKKKPESKEENDLIDSGFLVP
jgi:hypothetical protein